MKIAIRSGHTDIATGAVGLLDERKEVKQIEPLVSNLLKNNHALINCNSVKAYPYEVNEGINKANDNGADLFVSIHMNSADQSITALGSEIWLHPLACQETKNQANNILNNLQSLGFKNRGIKYSTDLAELSDTVMNAMIIEICFVGSKEDFNIYNRVGKNEIAFAIANGIDKNIKKNIPSNKKEVAIIYKKESIDVHSANILSWGVKDCIILDNSAYNNNVAKKVISVGADTGIKSDVVIKGVDRFDTVKQVLKYLGKI